jgi:RNA recognition motif
LRQVDTDLKNPVPTVKTVELQDPILEADPEEKLTEEEERQVVALADSEALPAGSAQMSSASSSAASTVVAAPLDNLGAKLPHVEPGKAGKKREAAVDSLIGPGEPSLDLPSAVWGSELASVESGAPEGNAAVQPAKTPELRAAVAEGSAFKRALEPLTVDETRSGLDSRARKRLRTAPVGEPLSGDVAGAALGGSDGSVRLVWPVSGEAISKLREQVELLLSDHNMPRDTWLKDTAAANGGVISLSVLASLPKLQAIAGTSDEATLARLIAAAFSGQPLSDVCNLTQDGQGMERVHDLPKSVNFDEQTTHTWGWPPNLTSHEQIHEVMSAFGRVMAVFPFTNPDRTFNGSALVEYSKVEEAQKANTNPRLEFAGQKIHCQSKQKWRFPKKR